MLLTRFVRDFLPRGSDNLQLVKAKLALLEATCDRGTAGFLTQTQRCRLCCTA